MEYIQDPNSKKFNQSFSNLFSLGFLLWLFDFLGLTIIVLLVLDRYFWFWLSKTFYQQIWLKQSPKIVIAQLEYMFYKKKLNIVKLNLKKY